MNKLESCRKGFPNPYTAFINDTDIMDFGAVVESFKISGSAVSNSIYQGRNRTTFHELAYTVGMKTITLNLFFSDPTRRQLTLNKSAVDALMVGKIVLHMPDGFYYDAILTGSAELQMLGVEQNQLIALCTYTFQGIQRDELRTVTGNTILAEGTAPRMDCRLKCTATANRSTLQVGTVTFSGINTGDEIVADGIDGILTVNGTPVVASFTKLPYLVPGEQTFACPETLTIEYYPTYI